MVITTHHIERLVIDLFLTLRESSGALPTPQQIASRAQKIFSRKEDELSLEERRPINELKPIANEIQRIAEGYTSNRQIAIPALTPEACSAYALYYMPINLEKIIRLLRHTGVGQSPSTFRVLDYGTGPGTASIALSLVRDHPFSLTAVDTNPSMRELARSLLGGVATAGKISSLTVSSPDQLGTEPFDLIIAAHVLNELPPEEQRTEVKRLLSLLSPNGSIVLVESALKEQTRELMKLRDYLLQSDSSLVPVFPCTHSAPCPMLTHSKDDWCHGNISWQPMHIVRQLDELTGFNKHRIKYSSFIFTRHATESRGAPDGLFRVVTPPEKSKIGHTLTLCGKTFYGIARCSKRVRDENNIEFRRAEHFDRLQIAPLESFQGDIAPTQLVTRERAP